METQWCVWNDTSNGTYVVFKTNRSIVVGKGKDESRPRVELTKIAVFEDETIALKFCDTWRGTSLKSAI